MLKKVKKLNYDYGYCPILEYAIINTAHIISVVYIKTRINELCVQVNLIGAEPIHCVGVPSDFLE